MIIDHLTANGVIDPGMLYDPPFSGIHHQGVEGVFGHGQVDELFKVVELVNARAGYVA